MRRPGRPGAIRPGRLGAMLACLAVGLLSPAGAQAARPMTLGFSDGAFTGPDGAVWLQRSAAAGADMVRVNIGWVAPDTPSRPRGFDARNPADPHYSFSLADAAIRRAHQLGLGVLATFTGAPQWAEGPGRPANAASGSWRPSPRALEDYGVALGLRYSGHFPDPAHPGQMLPRVEAFQVWNEPNLDNYLSPQWSGGRTAAPAIYRSMLNAFYRGLKRVDPSARVVTAGTGPFGDPEPGGHRIMPVRFWRDVLCVTAARGGGLRGTGCHVPAHFDILAHHLYSWGTPEQHALWPDDVAIPDMGKLTRVLRAAERTGGALPHVDHPVWVTEMGYNSKPPNPYGVPIAQQARWLEQTVGELWQEGVSAVFNEQVGDQPPIPSYGQTSQSGVYYLDGRPKPAFDAFRFPLVAWHAGRSTMQVWGRAPAAGRLVVEQLVRSGWRPLRVRDERAHATFLTQITDPGGVVLRARLGQRRSLIWH